MENNGTALHKMTPACAAFDGTAIRILFLKVRRRGGGMQKVKNKNSQRGRERDIKGKTQGDRNEKKEKGDR